jgi:hypothetical protein
VDGRVVSSDVVSGELVGYAAQWAVDDYKYTLCTMESLTKQLQEAATQIFYSQWDNVFFFFFFKKP